MVFRLRVLVILVLLMAATAVSVVVYLITRNAQKDEFEIQYEGVAEKVVESFTDIVKKMGAISGLGVAACAHAVDNAETDWPFITLSSFQQRAGNARTLSGTLYVSINPVVTQDQLPQWEQYVLGENSNWM